MAGIGATVYSFENTRGKCIFPGVVCPFAGRTTDGMVAEYNTPEYVTYTEVDGLGVHVVSVDLHSGSIVVTLQGASLASTILRKVLNAQRASRAFLIGSVDLSDLTGTNTLVTLTRAVLASQPGISYTADQPTIPWKFVGRLNIMHNPPVSLSFGVVPAPPPQLG